MQHLVTEIGGTARPHIIVVLCDGMGNNVIQQVCTDAEGVVALRALCTQATAVVIHGLV